MKFCIYSRGFLYCGKTHRTQHGRHFEAYSCVASMTRTLFRKHRPSGTYSAPSDRHALSGKPGSPPQPRAASVPRPLSEADDSKYLTDAHTGLVLRPRAGFASRSVFEVQPAYNVRQHLFFFKTEYYVYTTSSNGHRGCFHFSALVTNAAVHTSGQRSILVHVFNGFVLEFSCTSFFCCC